jgi:hypothetical protein
MKQTAVEWLKEQIAFKNNDERLLSRYNENFDLSKLFNQAKEMEKQQIENCFMHGQYSVTIANGEQYYNETFKQQEQ